VHSGTPYRSTDINTDTGGAHTDAGNREHNRDPGIEQASGDRDMVFTRYLQSRHMEEGDVGELARMALCDPTWPPASTSGRDRIAAYLRRRGVGPEVMSALAQAWGEYVLDRREARRGS
jgi:hypothetical protein